MNLKVKSFIYRFSAIFGLRVYLAQKEEDTYIRNLKLRNKFTQELHISLWQAQHGFVTVYIKRHNCFTGLMRRVANAFRKNK